MIQFISFVFGTLNLAQLQFWEDVAAVPQLSCDKKNVKIFTNKVGSEKKIQTRIAPIIFYQKIFLSSALKY